MTRKADKPQGRASHGARGAGGSRLAAEVSHLLSSPLNSRLLGIDVCGDVYSANGFRLLGVSACVEQQTVVREIGRFRTMAQLKSSSAARPSIQTGYDQRLPIQDPVRSAARLQNPRCRLLCEVFWPHVPADVFARIKAIGCIGSPDVIRALSEASSGRSGLEAALLEHALAIACHNLAITAELDCIEGRSSQPAGWDMAISAWNAVLRNECFWKYLEERAARLDDPRVCSEDVKTVRAHLPAIICGFNSLFARAYSQSGDAANCRRHLSLIAAVAAPASASQDVLISTVRMIAISRLDPVIQRANEELIGAAGKLKRNAFNQLCSPILDDAVGVVRYLIDQLGIARDLANTTEFDRLCDIILTAINTKIDYQGDNREKDILYGMLLVKRLLTLPISPHTRRKLEASLRSDRDILYTGFDLPPEMDPTECWFAEGEPADPDACITYQVYKITSRELQVDVIAGTGGTRVSYESRRVLVPRSARAQAFHDGKKNVVPPPRSANPETAALWSPVAPGKTQPFVFRDGTKAHTILDLAALCLPRLSEAEYHVSQGHLASWFEYRGQAVIAAKVRDCREGRMTVRDLVNCLWGVAASEVSAESERIRAAAAREVEKKNSDCEAEVKQIVQRRANALAKHEETVAAEMAALHKKVNETGAELKAQADDARERAKKAIAQAEERAEADIARAETQSGQTIAANRGFRGMLRLEAPLVPAAGLAVGGMLMYLGRADAAGYGAAAGLLALGICRMIRMARIHGAKASVAAPRKSLKREIRRIDSETNKAIADLKAKGDKVVAGAKARAADLKQQKEKVAQEYDKRVEALRKKCAGEVAEIGKRASSAINHLQERLVRAVEIKPKNQSKQFPAYMKAKSNGYSDGREPSSSDMEMTYSERAEAERRMRNRFGGW